MTTMHAPQNLCHLPQLKFGRITNPNHLFRLWNPPIATPTMSPLPHLPATHVLQTIMLGDLQQVGSSSDSVQTRNQPVLGKCLNLIMGMLCGSLPRSPLCIIPEHMRPLGSPPRFLTSNAFNREMWATFAGVVSICCFPLVARWARGS